MTYFPISNVEAKRRWPFSVTIDKQKITLFIQGISNSDKSLLPAVFSYYFSRWSPTSGFSLITDQVAFRSLHQLTALFTNPIIIPVMFDNHTRWSPWPLSIQINEFSDRTAYLMSQNGNPALFRLSNKNLKILSPPSSFHEDWTFDNFMNFISCEDKKTGVIIADFL